MNRYKFTEDNLKSARAFLKGADTGPPWAKKYKDDLKVFGKRIMYQNKPIIPQSRVEDFLRNQMFKKDGTLPFGRDAAFHKLSKSVVGVTRRHLMRFIKAQPMFEQTKAAVPKAKRKGGKKIKTYTFETDLIFIRKNDLVKSNPYFEKSIDKKETYMVSTVEKSTGLCRLDFVKSKISAVVTPMVLWHIRSMAKALKADLKDCVYRSDAGTEFNLKKIRKVIPDAKTVRLGSSVEKKNQDAQRVFYRILKARRSLDIPDAIHQTQKLLNETFNRIQGGTPNELVEAGSKFFNIKTYNASRESHIAGDRRKPFEVGQRVRIQIKKQKGSDIGFKSYKGLTFSKKIYIVRKIQLGPPRKYWVNAKWLLAEKLLGTEAEDEKTKEMIVGRDKARSDKEAKVKKDWSKEKAQVRETVRLIEEAEQPEQPEIKPNTDAKKIERKREAREKRRKELDEKLKRDEAALKKKQARRGILTFYPQETKIGKRIPKKRIPKLGSRRPHL